MVDESPDPRAVRSREAMLSAAGTLLTEQGLEAVTHQAVAALAGVGRAKVYRHWPQLVDLRMAVLSASNHDLPPAPVHLSAASGADPRAELAFHLRTIAARFHESAGVVVAAVIGGAEYDDGMRRLRGKLVRPMIRSLRPALAVAVERGLLRAGVTAEAFAMATVGPLFYQRFLVGKPVDDAVVDTVLANAWRAYAPTPPPQRHPQRGTQDARTQSRGRSKAG
jgi:AcrR family transcriptional regulator